MASKAKRQIKIPPLQIALLLLLAMVIAGALFYFMLYKPKENEIKQLNQQIVQQTSQLGELQDTRRNLLAVQEKASRLEKRLELLKSKLPENQEQLNEFLSSISQRGQNARISKWLLFEQHDPEPAGEVERVPIVMEFTATYASATEFFWELSNMGEGLKTGGKEQIVNVREIAIKKDTKEPSLVHVACVAETYLFRAASDEPKAEARKPRSRRGK